jgi:hypothetical protein
MNIDHNINEFKSLPYYFDKSEELHEEIINALLRNRNNSEIYYHSAIKNIMHDKNKSSSIDTIKE